MKFNWINKGMNKVLNKESAPAYRLTPEWELYTSVVTTSLNNSFYEQEEERIERSVRSSENVTLCLWRNWRRTQGKR